MSAIENPLNAIIDNGRCNLGHEWDERFDPDCALCTAVRDAIDVLILGQRGIDAALLVLRSAHKLALEREQPILSGTIEAAIIILESGP